MREIRCRVGRGLHRGLPRACMAPSGPRPLPESGLGRLWRPFDLAERGATLVRGWWLAGTGCGLRVAYRQDQIGTQLTTSVLPRRTYRRPRKRLVAAHPSWRVVRSISSSMPTTSEESGARSTRRPCVATSVGTRIGPLQHADRRGQSPVDRHGQPGARRRRSNALTNAAGGLPCSTCREGGLSERRNT